MAFKLNTPPYSTDNIPVYQVTMEDDVAGKANNNGSIVVNKDLDPSQIDETIAHEKVHIEQMKRGDLDYDDENVYWKGKAYPRSKMKEGAKNLPWEMEAYKNGKKEI
tara:strand:- start:266 stop:586 length:321 start_codon:yes stop_codon:yes gene_type:complete